MENAPPSRSHTSPPDDDEQLLVVHPDSMNLTCPSSDVEVDSDDPGGTHEAEYRPGSRNVASLLCCESTWVARHVESAYSCPTADGVSRLVHWDWVSYT